MKSVASNFIFSWIKLIRLLQLNYMMLAIDNLMLSFKC